MSIHKINTLIFVSFFFVAIFLNLFYIFKYWNWLIGAISKFYSNQCVKNFSEEAIEKLIVKIIVSEEFHFFSKETYCKIRNLDTIRGYDYNTILIKEYLLKEKINLLVVLSRTSAPTKFQVHSEIDLMPMDIRVPVKNRFEQTKLMKSKRHDIVVVAKSANNSS